MLPLNLIIEKKRKIILGLMSGTSCDGLDLALIGVEGTRHETHFELLIGETVPYSPRQRKAILNLIKSSQITVQAISQLNFYLPKIWSEMINTFISKHHIDRQSIDLIGSHGQTIWHQPEPEKFIDQPVASTLQIGDPAVMAQLTGIPVIGDFRVADVALGGQGAPLIAYFDWIYFSKFKLNLLVLNIGGISNLSLLTADGDFNKVVAFDCGPGNMLIDQAMEYLYGKAFDSKGERARSGRTNQELFEFICGEDSFLSKRPPKSTGREHYNFNFFQKILDKAVMLNIKPEDIICTLTDFSAFAIYNNYEKFIMDTCRIDQIVVGGGGSYNQFLMEKLNKYFRGIEVKSVKEYHLNEAFKEAIGFAILANETLHGFPANVPRATKASRPAILGKICLV